MKSSLYFVTLVGLFISPSLFALGQKRPDELIKNERISSPQILQNFSMTTGTGERVDFLQNTVSTGAASAQQMALVDLLPKPRRPQNHLCGKIIDKALDLSMELYRIELDLITGKISFSDKRVQDVLNKTPRCSPFLGSLAGIARYSDQASSITSSNPADNIIGLSVVRSNKEYMLELTTQLSKKIYLRTGERLKDVTSPQTLTGVRIGEAETGQAVGVQFRTLDYEFEEQEPTESRRPCTVTEVVQHCYYDENKKRRCDEHTYTRPGYEWVTTKSSSTYVKFSMDLVQNGQIVWTGQMSDTDFDSNSSSSGCH